MIRTQAGPTRRRPWRGAPPIAHQAVLLDFLQGRRHPLVGTSEYVPEKIVELRDEVPEQPAASIHHVVQPRNADAACCSSRRSRRQDGQRPTSHRSSASNAASLVAVTSCSSWESSPAYAGKRGGGVGGDQNRGGRFNLPEGRSDRNCWSGCLLHASIRARGRWRLDESGNAPPLSCRRDERRRAERLCPLQFVLRTRALRLSSSEFNGPGQIR